MTRKSRSRVTPGTFCASLLGVAAISLNGCHSAFVQATVVNGTGKAIHLFEVDYPSASFGSGELAAGAEYRYRFKVLGEGPATLSWTDFSEHEHKAKGPTLHEGEEGSLKIIIGPENASWTADVHRIK